MKNNLEREYQGQIHVSVGSPLNIYSLTDDEYTTNEVAAILGFIVLGFGLAFLLIRGSNKKNKEKSKIYNKKFLYPTYEEVQDWGFKGGEIITRDLIKKYANEIIDKHKYTLLNERKKFLVKDIYGKVVDKGWRSSWELKGDNKTALNYFFYNIANPFLDEKIKYNKKKYLNLQDFCNERLTYFDYEDFMRERIDEICDQIEEESPEAVDTSSMDGVQYEQYCKSILEDAGWDVEDTPTTGDQGVDLIASIEDLRVCIQCKCFAKAVGNKAVQEVAAGMIHWKGTYAVVVAKSGFTKSARTLAASNKVILISDSELENLENLVL